MRPLSKERFRAELLNETNAAHKEHKAKDVFSPMICTRIQNGPLQLIQLETLKQIVFRLKRER